MNFSLKNKLIITNPSKDLLRWANDNLVFDNPDYLKKEAMGKWTGNTERKIVLFEKTGDKLILPFGVAKQIYKLYASQFETIESEIVPIRNREYKSSISLYPYQENAAQGQIRAKNGIIVAPCGSGKTQIGLETAARIKGKCLWLTHTTDLLNQSMERAKSCFDMPPSEYGTITGGKVDIGNTITFATIQTMNNIDLNLYQDEWDVIIVDECHKCVGTPTKRMMFYKVVSSLSARYKIGLTATPYRSDGLDKCMFALLGEVSYEIKSDEVKEKTCPVEVQIEHTQYIPDYNIILAGDGTLLYASLIDSVCKDEQRNQLIINKINSLKGATLVLSDRLEHLKFMNDKCTKRSLQLSASDKKIRKEALKQLNDGEIDVIFATYKLAKEGLDVPNLRYLILATPQKDKATVIQACGRVARKAEGKEKGIIIDFVDNFGLLLGYARKRNSYYNKLKYEIIDNN